MSGFTVRITTNNAAFDDGGTGDEIARILRSVADSVAGCDNRDGLRQFYNGMTLLDINGNRVGAVSVTR